MAGSPRIRVSRVADVAVITRLYREAFPAEDLVPLVVDLVAGNGDVLSLVAECDGVFCGHIAFTRCDIEGGGASVALLGPLAVTSEARGKGVGGALVRDGMKRLEGEGVALVLVLGDPAYYGRFGFEMETRIEPPFALVEAWRAAWQSLPLTAERAPITGRLGVPEPWRRPALWAP